MRIAIRLPHIVSRILLVVVAIVAAVLPPAVASAGIARAKMDYYAGSTPPPFTEGLPPRPAHDPAKRTAVIVASAQATESSDFLSPYEVLARSGAFNLYAVAPERRPVPLVPGNLDIVPHYSFEEYDRLIGADPDLIVVPFLWNYPSNPAGDAPVLAWLKARTGARTTLLTICGGAWMAADAGLLAGHRATTHQNVLPRVRVSHPAVGWTQDVRWVEDGNVISSSGITGGVDATLRAVTRLVGRDAADRVARELHYPHARFLDDPAYRVPAPDMLAPTLSMAYRPRATTIGVVLYEGLSEVALASVIDTYPRSFAATVEPVAPERTIITSRHGLALLPRSSFATAPTLDRVLVPGTGLDPATAATADQWARTRYGRAVEYIHGQAAGAEYPYDVTLRDMAQRDSQALAVEAATGLEYPIEHLTLAGRAWPLDVLVLPVGLSLLGLAAMIGVRQWQHGRRQARPIRRLVTA